MRKSSIRRFFDEISHHAIRRRGQVVTTAMGIRRVFHAYDSGNDTFVFESGILKHIDEHASTLVAAKCDLGAGAFGHVLTISTGNHSVAALPLLSGKFWDLCELPPEQRSHAMTHSILVANMVGGKVEISQRDIACDRLETLDEWLVKDLGFDPGDVVMAERNDETLERFRERGLEWRVKPLAWTETEMRLAVNQSRKRIASRLSYYHSVKGVHFLSYNEFHRFAALAKTDFPAFCEALKEMVGVFEGNETSFMRQPKFHGHHEIELFGLIRGNALDGIIPKLEAILQSIQPDCAGCVRQGPAIVATLEEIDALFRQSLIRPELADENSKVFTDTLYMNLTGEIYAVSGDGTTPAFDDRRIALPGATFVNGAPQFHPGADVRTETLIKNVLLSLSEGELVEYANVYDLRSDDGNFAVGAGTREISFKTNCRPIVSAYVEKRLQQNRVGYGQYVLARANAFKALGVELPSYRLLRHRSFGEHGDGYDYYIRSRCEGKPLTLIPANLLSDRAASDKLGYLMGDAAAQVLAMKKYDPATKSALFDVGKEIYRFAWDPDSGRQIPFSVSICSLRGSCGWPNLDCDEANFRASAEFYMRSFADAVAHRAKVRGFKGDALRTIIDRFVGGFSTCLRSLAWSATRQREDFMNFAPPISGSWDFQPKMRFIATSLEWQAEHLAELIAIFRSTLDTIIEDI